MSNSELQGVKNRILLPNNLLVLIWGPGYQDITSLVLAVGPSYDEETVFQYLTLGGDTFGRRIV